MSKRSAKAQPNVTVLIVTLAVFILTLTISAYHVGTLVHHTTPGISTPAPSSKPSNNAQSCISYDGNFDNDTC